MGKLVRDRIPEIMRERGLDPEIRTLEAPEYLPALFDKLIEEAHELAETEPDQRLEEAADVLEVLLAIAHASGLTLQTIQEAAERKRVERGSFHARIWLERW